MGPRADGADDRPAHRRGGLRGRRRGARPATTAKLLDELGDLLFQVYFLALLLEERGEGDLEAVAEASTRSSSAGTRTCSATPRRDTRGRVSEHWEQIKTEQEGREGVFHDVPESLPALLYARKVQRRASRSATSTRTSAAPLAELDEELARAGRRARGRRPAPETEPDARLEESATCCSPS